MCREAEKMHQKTLNKKDFGNDHKTGRGKTVSRGRSLPGEEVPSRVQPDKQHS